MDGNRTHLGRLSTAPQTVLKTAEGTSPRTSPGGKPTVGRKGLLHRSSRGQARGRDPASMRPWRRWRRRRRFARLDDLLDQPDAAAAPGTDYERARLSWPRDRT